MAYCDAQKINRQTKTRTQHTQPHSHVHFVFIGKSQLKCALCTSNDGEMERWRRKQIKLFHLIIFRYENRILIYSMRLSSRVRVRVSMPSSASTTHALMPLMIEMQQKKKKLKVIICCYCPDGLFLY